jgi:hypothetical protein
MVGRAGLELRRQVVVLLQRWQRLRFMSTTNILLALIAAMLSIRWYPSIAYPVIAIALIGWALTELPKWRECRRGETAIERQLKADEPLRNEFWVKHKAIRDKYDPKHEWNEATSLPAAYIQEMDALNAEYRVVMDRWHKQ